MDDSEAVSETGELSSEGWRQKQEKPRDMRRNIKSPKEELLADITLANERMKKEQTAVQDTRKWDRAEFSGQLALSVIKGARNFNTN